MGTVFKVGIDGSHFTNLYTFTGGTDGAYPLGHLALVGTNLYGTASGGQEFGDGTVFNVSTDGAGFGVIHTFTGGTDGAAPKSGLTYAGGVLYGTAFSGGDSSSPAYYTGYGTLFGIIPAAGEFGALVVFNYTGGTVDGVASKPIGGVAVSGGVIYGTTSDGISGYGTVFAVNRNPGAVFYTTLHIFSGTDGTAPMGDLLLAGGNLYGTTSFGGQYGQGTVFKVSTNGSGFATPYNFSGSSDGANPQAGLILLGNTLYGTAPNAGGSGGGTVFAINKDGTGFTNLYDFTGGADGANLLGTLVASSNVLYGTTAAGGNSGAGTVFGLLLANSPPRLAIALSGPNAILT